jgi:hypothetical protein
MSLWSSKSGLLRSREPFAYALSGVFGPGLCSRTYSSQVSLQKIAASNERLKESLELFDSNEVPRALEIALQQYRVEFESHHSEDILSSSKTANESARPAFTFLSSLLASLGPKHPETIKTIALMRSTHPEATPFKPRVIQKSHGGYPVRLNNGKWTWQGPHWSRHNNRTWKSGYSSDFTYGQGK